MQSNVTYMEYIWNLSYLKGYYLEGSYPRKSENYLYAEGYKSEFESAIINCFPAEKDDNSKSHEDTLGLYFCQKKGWHNFLAREEKTDKIVEEDEFINGYKLVRFANGEFGYIRQSDGKILPHRFDIATSFNEYGLAMVGKNEAVSYITLNFEYLNLQMGISDYRFSCFEKHQEVTDDGIISHLFPLKKGNDIDHVKGFQAITAFTQGPQPFALVAKENTFYPINLSGEIVTMSNYYTNSNDEPYIETSSNPCLINGVYCVIGKEEFRIYLPVRKYFTFPDLLKFAKEKKLISSALLDKFEPFEYLLSYNPKNPNLRNLEWEIITEVIENGLLQAVIESVKEKSFEKQISHKQLIRKNKGNKI